MNTQKQNNIIFITGTDTGVGKTVLTGLLLSHLRRQGCQALAVKPFCSGGQGDVRALRRLQDQELTLAEINPFWFREPLAPLVAARLHRRVIPLESVLEHVQQLARRCDILLVEGAGGLLVPLGEGYSVAELIRRLECETMVVAANRLGVINHALLTVGALDQAGTRPVQVVLRETGRRDLAAASNPRMLAELLAPSALVELPFLGRNPLDQSNLEKNLKKTKKSIARLRESSNVCGLFFASR